MLEISDQVIQYVDLAGQRVAYSALGSGPPLVIGGWWCSHLALNWHDADFRRFVSELARHRRVVRYDRPGSGASRVDGAPPRDLDHEIAVLSGLVDILEIDRFSIFGASSGGAVAAGYSARHPKRVDRLVLYGAFARGADIASPDARAAMLDVIAGHWGLGSRVLTDLFLPGASRIEREEFAQFQRRSASNAQATQALAATYDLDVSADLADVVAPTTVIHREHDRAVPLALGVDITRRIRNAKFIQLDGEDHFPWRGDFESVTSATLAGLGHNTRRRAMPQGLSAVTNREREVFRLVAEGLTDAQIATRLTVSVHTVHRHVSNARIKLGLRSRAAVAATLAREAK